MLQAMLLVVALLQWMAPPIPIAEAAPPVLVAAHRDAPGGLFRECGLAGAMNEAVFLQALESRQAHHAAARVLAVADMSRPSTEQRLFIIDLEARRLLLRTWVAHGKNSGGLHCSSVSNQPGSLQTSRGMYRVGARIKSPKHGDALLLHGLDAGVNSAALEREVIIHAADYVGEAFIARHGRLGRSFGCPAVAPEVMPQVMELLEGQLLYIFADLPA